MRFQLSLALILAIAPAAAQEHVGRRVDPELFSPRKADAERGRAVAVGAYSAPPEVLQRGSCFQCHGIDGRGDGVAAFPRLTDQVFKYLYDSMKDYASGARQSEIMGPIAKALTDQQIRDVSAFYASQKHAPYGPRPDVDSTVLQAGGALAAVGSAKLRVQGCVNCHGPDGTGLPPTIPYLAGQHQLYLEGQLKAWKDNRRKGDSLDVMANIARRLTEDDIRAVSAYYAAIRPSAVTLQRNGMATPVAPSSATTIPLQP